MPACLMVHHDPIRPCHDRRLLEREFAAQSSLLRSSRSAVGTMNLSSEAEQLPKPDRPGPTVSAKRLGVGQYSTCCRARSGVRWAASALGAMCEIETDDPAAPNVPAEVVAFSDQTLKLIPFSDTVGVSRESRIRLVNRRVGLPVGPHLLGRVIDPWEPCSMISR